MADPKGKFILVLCGQVLASTTQPLVLSMPTKLAALWFGDHERTVANTIASMGKFIELWCSLYFTVCVAKISCYDSNLLMVDVENGWFYCLGSPFKS